MPYFHWTTNKNKSQTRIITMKKQFLKTAFSTLIVSSLWGGVNAQVGIGTTIPSNDLDVESGDPTKTAIEINNTSTGDPKINFQFGVSAPTFSIGVDNSDDDKFKIGTSALETNTRFTIDASGNCGIGTSSPNAPLQFANALANRKIVFYESVNNDHEFWGFGFNPMAVRYQLGSASGSHLFYAGTSSTTSTELMRISGNGYVGIGTASPSYKLHVSGTTSLDGSTIVNASGAATNFTVGANILVANGTTGGVGIGNANPNAPLQFANGVAARKIVFYESANNDHQVWGFGFTPQVLRYQIESSGAHKFYAGTSSSNSNELMAINGDGNVTINGGGTSGATYKLQVNGQPGANGYTAFTNYSDSRLKTNITNLDTGALSKIMQLRPVSFQYNQKYLQLYAGSDLQKVHKGFIAQEIRQVFPEMVSEMKASADSVQYLDLNVSHLQVYLVKALQEQQAIIEAQKKEIDAQKAETTQKITDLENKMNAMLLLLDKKEEVTAKQ